MIARFPFLIFLLSLAVLAAAAWLGATRFARVRTHVDQHRDEFGVIQGATLTLLGLIIGFTFSMALNRYESRISLEEEEANAIGTEYLRADLLPASDAERVRALLRSYVEQRVLFYEARELDERERVDAETARLQAELWAAVRAPALAQPSPLSALAVSGMNDVLNSQGYTQAAWTNRIPPAAWVLMASIALFATLLVGIGIRTRRDGFAWVLLVLPAVTATSFFLIADIDSPRQGTIRVAPQNLLDLSATLRSR
jgi:hypothetical protein